MANSINTNIASLNAQRNLNSSQNDFNTSLQRLSSGLRINSAKDDAAGLAISERFTSQIRGLNQAARNANDGISLAQTAEGALAEVTNNLQRIRELAVQSANATNSASDRAALDAEAQELISEIDRVSQQTNFNSVQLLDGSFSAQVFQVGANVGDTITISTVVDSTALGLGLDTGGAATADITGGAITGALVAGDLTINGTDVGIVAQDAVALATAIDTAAGASVATAQATSATIGAFTGVTGAVATDTYGFDVEGVTVEGTVAGGNTTLSAAELDTALTAATAALTAAGVSFTGTFAGDDLVFSKADGSTLDITAGVHSGAGAGGVASGAQSVVGTVNISSTSNLTIAGANPGTAGFTAGLNVATSNINLLTVGDSNATITAIDSALTSVNSARANLGAIQNRFESVIVSVATTSENLSASRSRIQDTDFAAETANLTRAQILQQAGIAILAQANAAPQNVLQLLQ